MALGEVETDEDDTFGELDEEIDDAQDAEDLEFEDSALENASNMTWHAEPTQNKRYFPFNFVGSIPGPTKPVTNCLEAFQLFVTPVIMEIILTETNRILSAKGKRKKGAKQIERKLVNENELWIFIAVTILIEIHGKNKISDNWKTDEYLFTPIFPKLMTLQRYKEILSCLHFANNATDCIAGDRFWKIRKIFDGFNANFDLSYNLSQEVSVDESLLLWKGHHSLKRYIPSKSDRWGFKFYALGESYSGYIKKLLLDEGKTNLI